MILSKKGLGSLQAVHKVSLFVLVSIYIIYYMIVCVKDHKNMKMQEMVY